MPVSEEITQIRPEGELHTCPACGYGYGFHTSFIDANAATGPVKIRTTNRVFRVILICPECGARFDIGWRIQPVEMPVRVQEAETQSLVAANRLPEPARKTGEE